MNREWIEVSMQFAIDWLQGKTLVKTNMVFLPAPNASADVRRFTDGTAIAVLSVWDGPYSTDDNVNASNPVWWIYDTLKGVKK